MPLISDLYLESKGKKGQKLNCPHYIPQSDSLDVSLAVSVIVVVLLVIATWSNPLLPINFSTAAALNANPLRDWKSMRPNTGDAIGFHHRCLGQMQTNSTSYVMCKDKKGGNGWGGAQGNYNNQILTNIYKTKRKALKNFGGNLPNPKQYSSSRSVASNLWSNRQCSEDKRKDNLILSNNRPIVSEIDSSLSEGPKTKIQAYEFYLLNNNVQHQHQLS